MSEGTTTTDTAESTTTTTTTTISSNNSTIDKIHQTQAQWDAIEQEIKDTQPLTSAVRPLEDLRQQYQTGDGVSNKWYDLGVQVLMKTYLSIRMVRGDGNCYYRAFLYSMCEQLMNHPIELERITKLSTYLLLGFKIKRGWTVLHSIPASSRWGWTIDAGSYVTFSNVVFFLLPYPTLSCFHRLVKDSNQQVISIGGYEEMAIEIFYDTLVELLERLNPTPTTTNRITSVDALQEELTQESSTSDYCTWYLRVLTATFLKSDPSRFLPYLEDGYDDIATYCATQIEPMGKECTMVQVLALAEYLQIPTKIEYLDGHEFANHQLTHHWFGPPFDGTSIQVNLLYRPGHYDILYRKD